jgi:sugar phosphate isomerase/epimerase
MVGILKTSFPGADEMGFRQLVHRVAEAGFDALMATSIFDLSAALDEAEILDVQAEARAAGVELAAGLGGFHPLRHERCAVPVAAGGGDLLAGVARLAGLAARTGLGDLFFAVGMIADREDPDLPWARQLAAVEEGLVALAPRLRDAGTRLLIKTHEEITTHEILRLISAVGEDVLGVAHDPVNVVCRMEEPVAATRRLAPYIRQFHIDDAALRLDGDQVRRYLTRLGEGDLDWPAMLTLVPTAGRWIEIHRGQFAMACFDRAWMAWQPEVSVDEYCFVAGAAVRRGPGPAPYDQANPFARIRPMQEWLAAYERNRGAAN